MEVPPGLRESPRWWHDPAGRAWLDGLPALVDRTCARWLVAATGLDRSRAEAWLLVRTVGYWLWCIEAGLSEDPERCARVVAALRSA